MREGILGRGFDPTHKIPKFGEAHEDAQVMQL